MTTWLLERRDGFGFWNRVGDGPTAQAALNKIDRHGRYRLVQVVRTVKCELIHPDETHTAQTKDDLVAADERKETSRVA